MVIVNDLYVSSSLNPPSWRWLLSARWLDARPIVRAAIGRSSANRWHA